MDTGQRVSVTNETTAPDRAAGGSALAGEASVSVVICVYDAARWDAIRRAVASLEAQTHPVDEVIVVVDHNPDLFVRVADEIEGVIAIQNDNERGLSGARNSGAAVARGEFVAFLDDDAAAAPDWVEQLVAACDGGVVLGAGGRSLPRWLDRRPSWFPEEFLWVVGCTYRGLPEQTARVRNIYGGCFAIRRDALAELGGFRAEFGRVGSKLMCVEETELCIRATRRWPDRFFVYVPGATIDHDVPGQRSTWSYYRRRCFAEGISKARLTRHVGSGAGLKSERSHAAKTLPAGVVREIALGLRRGEPSRVARAGAIVAGLTVTVAGYAVGLLRPLKEAS
jgi:GT2 family glycosyltransferase